VSRIPSLLPPRRRDWTPGRVQTGLFIRNKDGTQVEFSSAASNAHVERAAWWMLHVSACKDGCPGCFRGRRHLVRASEILNLYLDRKKAKRTRVARRARNPKKNTP
jgi:hypothetical protein